MDQQLIIIMIASVAAIASVLAVALPFLMRDNRSSRMNAVSKHRHSLGLAQREELTRADRRRGPSSVSFMKALLEKLKLENLFSSAETRNKLTSAGWRSQNAVIVFTFSKLGIAVLFALVTFIFISLSPGFTHPFYVKLLIAAASSTAGFFLPDLLVKNKAQNRSASMTLAFPDALDLLVICVEAGLSIEGAFAKVTEEIAENSPILSQEFGLTSAELAFLGDRAKAYRNFAERTQMQAVHTLSTTLTQSEKYGTPVSVALKVLSQENREERMSKAEKKAAALPAQLTVPMIIFFLPPLFVVIIGPSVLRVMKI
ncbi:MAG: type II secretion system F family protein [Rhodospirillales bacterium]|nr:type II secretion system F family protein [Rhodospirillales bacterium]